MSSIRTNDKTAEHLLGTNFRISYQKLIQMKQRCKKIYIDIVALVAVAEVTNFHVFLQKEISPEQYVKLLYRT